ncbi:hypothetical protein LSTR_LSTR006890 [Laodelphax striatellus]|uniref:Uncharacterized protein n=2 Tax=Laodelphax striatellus TaxID=195883 RepID=A0A482XFI8_LAOST|nr:hypothetical protein LSTR_LSTR006890 [Laodelphax striatellus]
MITITPTPQLYNASTPNFATQPPNNRFMPPQRFHGPRHQFFQPFKPFGRGGPSPLDPEFDGKRLRKSAMRKTVDYNSAIIKMLEGRVWQRDYRDRRALQPDAIYIPDLLPPPSYEENPINAVTTRFVKTATNKMRCPVFCMAWTPEGRRLVTGASSGEFTLWNGLTFNFETILQAHESPVRTMVWSHNDIWMVTADHSGYVKYWQSNMNSVKVFLAHKEAIRGISFSPNDSKFATCSDDGTVRIWDFMRCHEERILRGHGADVKCVHWHPQKGLVVSGSKDNQQPVKLWDPKTGQSLATLHAHKSTVMDVKWNKNGNWLVTASRDHLLKLFDIRNLSSEVQTFRGHKKESSSIAWHPYHEGLFCSGGSDGAILFWHVGADKEVGAIEQAHDSIVWTLAWHPLGHILCSGSNDHTSKFWTRNRPGDMMRDKYNLNTLPASLGGVDENDIDDYAAIPGMGPEDKVDLLSTQQEENTTVSSGVIPGLDFDPLDEKNKIALKKVPYSKPIPKNFQAQWNATRNADDDDSKKDLDPIAIINSIVEKQPGVIPLTEVEPESLFIYGKMLKVEAGTPLAEAIAGGAEKLYKYVNSGVIPELREVMPYYDVSDTERDEVMSLDDDDGEIDPEHLDPYQNDMFFGNDVEVFGGEKNDWSNNENQNMQFQGMPPNNMMPPNMGGPGFGGNQGGGGPPNNFQMQQPMMHPPYPGMNVPPPPPQQMFQQRGGPPNNNQGFQMQNPNNMNMPPHMQNNNFRFMHQGPPMDPARPPLPPMGGPGDQQPQQNYQMYQGSDLPRNSPMNRGRGGNMGASGGRFKGRGRRFDDSFDRFNDSNRSNRSNDFDRSSDFNQSCDYDRSGNFDEDTYDEYDDGEDGAHGRWNDSEHTSWAGDDDNGNDDDDDEEGEVDDRGGGRGGFRGGFRGRGGGRGNRFGNWDNDDQPWRGKRGGRGGRGPRRGGRFNSRMRGGGGRMRGKSRNDDRD